ncbi:MAG: transcriptional regulator [Candidatus Eremiobacteraeota bacterium]|nr:transcriptional regulator [Candidatus Eremiobacteraeota bacterium]
MATRAYGQYCGLARALELVGERWALLVIRDLLVGPKRFGELQRGLPRIPSNILTARLKELEDAGLVQRRAQSRDSGGGVVYELTSAGRELEATAIALGRWGAKRLGEPRPEEIVTEDSMAIALRSTFRPENAGNEDIAFELHVGEVVVNARVSGGSVSVGKGKLAAPDLVIESGPEIGALMARELTPKEALKSGAVRVRGKRALLDRFAELFVI